MSALTPNVPQFWEELYAEGKDVWSLGMATPALLDFFEHPVKARAIMSTAVKTNKCFSFIFFLL